MSKKRVRGQRQSGSYRSKLRSALMFEELEKRALLAATNWTNPLLPMDVTQDRNQSVDPLDVLVIINELNGPKYTTETNRRLPNLPDSNREPRPYFDVDCDGFVSPLDALIVINTINSGIRPTGWKFDINSQSVDGGFVSSASCGPRLYEGTSYLTEISREIVIPENATNLSFRISDAFFDLFSPAGMKDAFEVALVDENGKSLVLPFAANRDALLNMSEEQATMLAPGVRWVDDQVLVNVSQIPPNTTARLIARLVNNDLDTKTSVAIRDVMVETQGEAVPISSSIGRFDSRSEMTIWEDQQGFTNVTGNLVLLHGRTSHVDDSGVIFSDVAVENAGDFSTPSTIRVVFKNFSDPTVSLRNPDGFTSQGDPFIDFTASIQGAIFKPNSHSTYRQLGFANPNQSQFTYETEFYVKANRDPAIQSSPNIEALLDRPYRYQVVAHDPDLDDLEYSLIIGPSGMIIDKQTGLVNWEATTESLGNHSVSIQVADPFGGSALQSFVLTAMVPPPNRPPVISSLPVTSAYITQKVITSGAVIDFDDLPGVFFSAGTTVPEESQLTTQYLRSHGVAFSSYGSVSHAAVVNLDSLSIGHARSSPNGISGVSGSNGIDYTTPIEIRFYSPTNPSIAAFTNHLSITTDSFGNGREVRMEAYDILGRLIDNQEVLDSGGNKLQTEVPGIHFVRIFGSGTAGFDDLRLGPLFVLSGNTNASESDSVASIYRYNVAAKDSDGDTLTYSLIDGPLGMKIDTATGSITWTPTTIPKKNVALGLPESHYSASSTWHSGVGPSKAFDGAPNTAWNAGKYPAEWIEVDLGKSNTIFEIELLVAQTPSPAFTSHEVWVSHSPIGSNRSDATRIAVVNQLTEDGEKLRLPLDSIAEARYVQVLTVSGPSWVSWSEISIIADDIHAAMPIEEKVELEVSDGRGGIATQEFVVSVFPNPESNAPIIVSDPISYATQGQQYTYQALAVHPEDDALDFRLLRGPSGMTIGPQTGSVNWEPRSELRLYNSGVNAEGVPLSEGSLDPNWTITAGPGIVAPTPAIVVDSQFLYAHSPQSRWVWVNRSGNGGGNVTYTFQQKIDLTGYDLSTVVIKGEWGSDNFGTIRLNEASPLGTGTFSLFGVNGNNFSQFHDFQITGGFVPGINTLDFVITDVDGLGAFGVTGLTVIGSLLSDVTVTVRVIDDRGGFDDQSWTIELVSAGKSEVHGKVWHDVDRDGTRSFVSEPGLGNRTVFIDANRNGLRDSEERWISTDVAGNYAFLNLLPGKYYIAAERPLGWQSTSPAANWQVIEVGASQNITGIDFGHVEVVTSSINRKPTIVSSAVRVATIGQIYRYEYYATDADADTLAFDLAVSPRGMVVHSDSSQIAWKPTLDQLGSHTVILRADDGLGGIDLQSFVINVVANTAPVILSQPRGPATIGLPWQYQVIAQDAEGDQLEFALLSSPAGMTIDKSSGLVRWVPDASDAPQQRVEIRVRDGQSETIHDFDLPIVLTSDNDAPLILSSPSTTAVLSREYIYQLVVDDANGDPLSYELVLGPSGMTLNDSTGLVRWKPTVGQIGRNYVTIRVEDGLGGVTEQVFVVDVRLQPRNFQPAIVSIPTRIAIRDVPYSYDAKAIDPDFDLFRWSLLKGPSGLSIGEESGSVRWTPTANQIGEHRVEILVSDSSGGQANQVFTLLVEAANSPPIITSNPPTRTQVGVEWFYPIQAVDKNGDELIVSVLGPTEMVVDQSAKTLSWTPSAAQIGIHEITVLVSDGRFTAQQKFDLEVTSEALNEPPVVTSDPSLIVAVNADYIYRVTAVDADSDPISYSLREAPEGMVIDGSTGVLTWTPTVSDIGLKQVSIIASDPNGGRFLQSYGLRVLPPNQAPTIVSEPRLSVTRGAMYRYVVRVQHTNQQAVRFELTESPPGMTIDQRGTLQWNSSAFLGSSTNIGIRVSDGLGGIAEQNYVLQVNADISAPQIIVNATPQVANLGDDVIFALEDTDNIGVVDRKLWIDGTLVPLDSVGRAYVRMTRAGNIPILALAKDAGGIEGRFEHFIQVVDPSDSDAPIAMLQSPSENESIRSITDIIGSVSDSNFAYYTLSIASLEGTFREIARGTSQVTQGLLGRLDPSLLANDSYRLRLEAFDSSGKSTLDERLISVVGDLKLGNFTLSFADLSVPVSGVPISVVRTYDTLTSEEEDDFGYGWRMEFRDTNLRTNVPKTGSEEDLIFNPFFAGARVFLQLPGGKREGFTFQPKPASGLRGSFLGIFEPSFIPDRGVTSQLTVPNTSLSVSASGDVFAYGSGQPFHPASPLFGNTYRLTTAEGVTYEIDGTSGDLRTIADLNGNEVKFDDNEIASSSGPKVQFERDAQGRILSVIDPAGQKIRYTYDRFGDLTAVTDRAGNTTRFVYRSDRPHYLEKILDPLGREGIRTEYDENGRLTRTVDALGNAVRQDYDLANSKVTVFDQLGNPTQFEYDDQGNVVTETNALGEVTRRTYDEAGNVLEETNPLGQKTIRTYDRFGNVLTEKDPLGNMTYTVYGPNGQVLSSVDALGNATVNEYDSKGNLLRTTAPGGVETAMTYDRAGNPTSLTFGGGTMGLVYDSSGRVTERRDALGNVTRYTYDTFGNQLTSTTQMTKPSGVRELVTSMDYDANNRVIRTIDSEGGISRVEYNPAGNKVADIDALGRRTEYRYDERGLLIETIYPDASPNDLTDNPRTRTEYDAAGREVARIDELGRRTEKRYDKVGRHVETIFPDSTPNDLSDNPRTRTEYDAAGHVIAEIDERGNRTEFEYDAGGRRVLVRDALGNVTRNTLDAAGRQVAVTDALNQVTRFVYDAAGRRTETLFSDGTKTVNSFNADGKLIGRTDQLGRMTKYEYDQLNRLTAVVDALGQRTEYAYNEAGNLISQKDANGNVMRYEYDGLGRRIASQLPMGQRSESEYDAVGNVIRSTDFNGDSIEYSYDARNRLVSKSFPGGSVTQFTYTLNGQRQSSVDGRGTTNWHYDERNRLVSRIDPDGQSITYTYDAAGNRTTLTTAAGTIAYSFDALNRMATVVDPSGGTTRYEYNPVSNLVRTDLPNGTWETREYDPLNRLVYLENNASSGVISSYRYTLAATGRRDSVVEHSGRRVDYQYDALDRLTLESIIDSIVGNRSISYSYDPVGNRLARNDSAEGVISYTYDDNDRLLTETINGVMTDYAYDANGNTLSKINAVDRVFYDWDFENRLIAVDTDGNGEVDVTNLYDVDGIRVAQLVGTDENRYLIDAVQPFQQVALEYTPGGIIKASYVHGLDLISQNRPDSSGNSYYHVDGLGSTRALSNGSGIITDRYNYEAFGRRILQEGTTTNVYIFAGEQRDVASGLDYLRARWMNPSVGRFYGRDLFAGFNQNPITLNKYLYANSNPVNLIDPSGNFAIQIAVTFSVNATLQNIQASFARSGLTAFARTFAISKTVLEPAAVIQTLGLLMIAEDLPGGEGMYRAGRLMTATGFKAVQGALRAIYSDTAKSLVTFKVDVNFSVGQTIDSIFKIKEKLESVAEEIAQIASDLVVLLDEDFTDLAKVEALVNLGKKAIDKLQ